MVLKYEIAFYDFKIPFLQHLEKMHTYVGSISKLSPPNPLHKFWRLFRRPILKLNAILNMLEENFI